MASIVCACGKPVETQPEWAGQWINCPGCGGSLYAPYPGSKPAPAPVVESATRLCGCCSETIPTADQKCRFCGNDPGGRPAARPQVVQATVLPSTPAAQTGANDAGIPVLIMAIVGYMFCCVLCPIAWAMGSNYEARCKAQGIEPSGSGKAGKIVGMIGSGVLVLNILGFAAWVVLQCH